MVAVHGKMLESIRFFSNYKSVSIKQTQAVEDDAENIRTVDQGENNIARLIKELFNSPDRAQFVATTYKETPVGNLSQNLGKINDIIETLVTGKRSMVGPVSIGMDVIQPREEISDDAKALIEQIKDLEKEINHLKKQKKIDRKPTATPKKPEKPTAPKTPTVP